MPAQAERHVLFKTATESSSLQDGLAKFFEKHSRVCLKGLGQQVLLCAFVEEFLTLFPFRPSLQADMHTTWRSFSLATDTHRSRQWFQGR